jgi:hypothetical protein
MTHQIFNLPPQQPLTAAGRVLPGAKAYFFLTNSSTPTPVYTTSALDVAHSVPVEADLGGRFPTIYLDPTVTYKLTVNTAADVLLYTIDPCNDVVLSQALLGEYLYPQTAAEIAANITPENYAVPSHEATGYVHSGRYGADPTGSDATDDILEDMIAVSANASHAAILFAPGKYRFTTGNIVCGYGIKIMGSGSQGSNEDVGTVFLIDFNTNYFVRWDGSGGAGFLGTGGGFSHLLMVIADGRTPGQIIYEYAIDDDHRPGEMMHTDVLIYGLGTGVSTCPLEIDGRNANTPGGKGVRTTHFHKVRVASSSTNNKYAWFRQATHVYGDLQMDTGNGTGTLGMTIDDDWDHIYLDLRVGNVIVNYTGSANPSLNLRGSCSSLDINSTAVIGSCPIKVTTGITSQATLVRISSHIVDDFTAFVSSTIGNATGDATAYTILFDTESYDANSSYDPSTGIYTVKVAGICDLDWGTVLTSLGAAHTTGELTLDHRDSGGSSRNQISTKYGVGPMRDAANQCGIQNHIKLKVFEGDTLRVVLTVSGSTKTVGVGGAATRYSYFSAKTLA